MQPGSWSWRTTFNLKLVRDVLSPRGFDVVAARSAEQGVALAASAAPDLVLMDLQLPGIDGTEALATAAREPPDREPARRRGDGVRDAGGPRPGARAGFDGYLDKPTSCAAPPDRRCAATSRGRRRMTDARGRCSSSTTCREPPAAGRRARARAGYDVRHGRLRARRRSSALAGPSRRPRAAGHPDAGDGRLRGLPPDPRRTRRRAFLPVVMITASGEQEKIRPSRPAPTTSSPSLSTRPSCWPG